MSELWAIEVLACVRCVNGKPYDGFIYPLFSHFFFFNFLSRIKFMGIKNAYVHFVLRVVALWPFTVRISTECVFVLKFIDENILWSLEVQLSYMSLRIIGISNKNEINSFSRDKEKKMDLFDDSIRKLRWNAQKMYH